MQADLAQREAFNAEELKQSLKQIGRSSIRATHTVNQLLALARAESSGQTIAAAALRPGPHRHGSGAGLGAARAGQAHRPGLRRRPAGRTGRARWRATPRLLKELIRNLLDNAINYTPSSASIPA